ncbi:MAG: hypothetical protein U9O78_02325 [Patescibacteria group bacterium]|nr:hypothetical protein [Patescibacteria group bacterium]
MLKTVKKKIKELKVVDYYFLLFLILVLGFFIYKFSRKAEVIYVDLMYEREGYVTDNVPPEYWKIMKIKEGDVGFDSFGREVVDVVSLEQSYWRNGRRNYVRLVVKMDVIFNNSSKNYVFQGSPLLIGNDLELNFGESKFKGKIVNIYKSIEDRFDGWRLADAIIKLTAEGVEPWLAQNLRTFTIDSKDYPIETLSSEVKSAVEVIETADGRLVEAVHPINKDVELVLRLENVLCKEAICFYRYQVPLTVGALFYADAGDVFLPDSSIEELNLTFLE